MNKMFSFYCPGESEKKREYNFAMLFKDFPQIANKPYLVRKM